MKVSNSKLGERKLGSSRLQIMTKFQVVRYVIPGSNGLREASILNRELDVSRLGRMVELAFN